MLLVLLLCLNNAIALNVYLDPLLYQGTNELSATSCSRILNGKGSTGCQAMENPYGTLKRIDTAEELTSHFDSNNGLIKRNFALVIPYELLTTTILSEIESNGGVGGILVINSNLTSSTLTSYSPDSKFPNQDASLYNNDASQHAWNPTGDDLRLQSFTFPITVLTKGSQSYNEILEALEFNNAGNYDPPVYAMQWDAEMFAAVDSRTCLRRARCKPIGDSSVWASFSNYSESETDGAEALANKPIILINAQIGGSSLGIKEKTGGAQSQFSGVIALLAIADALKNENPADFAKSIVFGFFGAESFDYSGSGRFSNDISSNFVCNSRENKTNCPYSAPACTDPCISSQADFERLSIDSIEGIMDFSNVMSLSGSGVDKFYMHVDEASSGTDNLMSLVGGGSSNVTIERAWDGTPGGNLRLPPSSMQSFLKQKRDIPGIAFGDFKDELSNPFYNSEFDKGRRFLNEQHAEDLCQIVNSTARAIYKWANSEASIDALDPASIAEPPASVTANCSFVSDLLDCYTRNHTCSTFYPLFAVGNNELSSFYAGNSPARGLTPYAYITFFLAHHLTSRPQMNETLDFENNTSVVTCKTAADCDGTSYRCVYSQCTRSSTNSHPAYGVGIEYDVGKGEFYVADENKSAWTQSIAFAESGRRTRERLLLLESDVYSGVALGVSLVLTIAAYFIAQRVYTIKVKLN